MQSDYWTNWMLPRLLSMARCTQMSIYFREERFAEMAVRYNRLLMTLDMDLLLFSFASISSPNGFSHGIWGILDRID